MGPLRSFVADIDGLGRATALSCAASTLKLALLAPIPLLAQDFVSRVGSGVGTATLVWLGAAILALQVGATVVGVAGRRRVLHATQRAIRDLRERSLRKVYEVPRSEHDRLTSGGLHDLLVQDVGRIETMTFVMLADVIPSAVVAAGLGAVLVTFQWRLFLVTLCLVPLNLAFGRLLGTRLVDSVAAAQAALREYSRGVLRLLDSLDLPLTHGAEFELERQRRSLERVRASATRSQVLFDASGALQQTVVALSTIVVMLVGGLWIRAGDLDLDSLVFFLAGLALLRGPVTTLILSVAPVMSGHESLRKLFSFLSQPAQTLYQGTRRIDFAGRLELRRLAFSYGEAPLLREIDLRLDPGEIVAIVGPNGAGKTTLVRLVLGVIGPASGLLLADDQPYEDLDIPHLRRSFGALLQEPTVLAGSVRENVTYGLEGVADADIEAALEAAGALAWARRLPQRLETEVGERGAFLSGGEGQQLALARVLLRRPRLLILDEPTTHLDGQAVERLLRGLRENGAPTTLLVSHEAQVLQCADRVLALRDGQLLPAGS